MALHFRPSSTISVSRGISAICLGSLHNTRPWQDTRRPITNDTKLDHVPDLHSVKQVASKPGGWQPTLIHSSGEVKWTVIRLLASGGEVPKHYHNKVWDYFVPLEGEAMIETESKDGQKRDYHMTPGGFLAVGPEYVHRVRNLSGKKPFVFLIAQSPRGEYDFIRA